MYKYKPTMERIYLPVSVSQIEYFNGKCDMVRLL